MKSSEKRRNKAMNHRDEIKIAIEAVSDREGEYVAYYRSEFLNATFSVYFRDTIFGAIALHDFTEMRLTKTHLSVSFAVIPQIVSWNKGNSRGLFDGVFCNKSKDHTSSGGSRSLCYSNP
jgi:hypothetical protein